MAFNWSKVFSRINWLNSPDTSTPINQDNLNRVDTALNTIDDRVIQLDTAKLDKSSAIGFVSDFAVNEETGVITVSFFDGSTKTFDTNLEKISVNYRYDNDTQTLYVINADGTEQPVDLSSLISQFEFLDSATIAFSISDNGEVSATIKAGSVTDDMIEANYLANIKVESAKAETSSQQASAYADNSAYDSKLSQSYAIGGSGIREEEDTDNAKYYKEQSALYATNANNSVILATEQAELAQTSATNAATSESNARTYATNAGTSADSANQYATNASNSASTANTSATNASASEELARTYATNAGTSADSASSFATQSQNYAVGDTDSSKYYYEQTKQISESFAGALRPMGTVAFANLPSLANATEGDMYNISDEFVTTADFNEGEGVTIPVGSNVYKTAGNKWDILAGTPVTGVKGANETSFRRGNVNITAENIGALRTDGDSADNIVTFTSNDNLEPTEITDIPIMTSGEKHSSLFSKISTIFKNVRYLIKELGTTDISTIGDGTVKGAVSTLNSNLSNVRNKFVEKGTINNETVTFTLGYMDCYLLNICLVGNGNINQTGCLAYIIFSGSASDKQSYIEALSKTSTLSGITVSLTGHTLTITANSSVWAMVYFTKLSN